MHAGLSEEQQQFADSVSRLAERFGTHAPTELEGHTDDTAAWQALTQLGLTGLRVPERAGGSGASGVEVAIAAEMLGRSLCALPFIGSAVMATELLVAAGAPDDLLLALAQGDVRFAITVDDGLREPAPHGVAFDAAGAPEAIIVRGESVGTTRVDSPVDAIDLTRVCSRVETATDTTTIGAIGDNARMRWEALALSALSADMVGVMEGALAAAVTYARERKQFGRPIGSFQAVQHLCAEQLVAVAGARSVTWHAAWAVDQLEPAAALLAARTAKVYCSEVAPQVCEATIQVFGGIGMTWECIAHLYLRRALLDRQTLGDERIQLAAISAHRVGAPA